MKIPLPIKCSVWTALIVGGFMSPLYAQAGYNSNFSNDPVVRSVEKGSPYIVPPSPNDSQRSGVYTDGGEDGRGYPNSAEQHHFRKGDRLPPRWRSSGQSLSDWAYYGLPAPGNNQQWMRFYHDIFLIDAAGTILAIAGQNNGPAAYYDGYYGNNGYVGGNYYAPPVGYNDYYNYGGAYQPAPPPPPPPPPSASIRKRQYKQPEGNPVSPITEDDAKGWRSDPPRQGGVSYDEREEYTPHSK